MTQQFHFWGKKKSTPKKKNPTNSKGYMHSNIHDCTIYSSYDMEATQVSTNRWTDKDVAYLFDGILLNH